MAAYSLDFKDLRNAYSTGLTPSEVILRLYPRLASEHGMFNFLLPLDDLLSRCRYAISAEGFIDVDVHGHLTCFQHVLLKAAVICRTAISA